MILPANNNSSGKEDTVQKIKEVKPNDSNSVNEMADAALIHTVEPDSHVDLSDGSRHITIESATKSTTVISEEEETKLLEEEFNEGIEDFRSIKEHPTLEDTSSKTTELFEKLIEEETIHIEGPFADTDLIVFKDTYTGKLPLNGITTSQFKEISEQYEKICKGLDNKKGKFVIAEASDYFDTDTYSKEDIVKFTQIIKNHFKILLTREIGRNLILALLNDKEKKTITIEPKKGHLETQAFVYGRFDHVSMTFDPKMEHQRYEHISFAHELIHIYHGANDYVSMTPSLGIEFDNVEEQYAITGWIKFSIDRFNQDVAKFEKINENNLRSEFQVPYRIDHHHLPPETALSNLKIPPGTDEVPKEIAYHIRKAVRYGWHSEIDRFVKANSDREGGIKNFTYKGSNFLGVLLLTINTDDPLILQKLIQLGADKNLMIPIGDGKENYKWNLCQYLVAKGAGRMLKYLYSSETEWVKEMINQKDHEGNTALHIVLDDLKTQKTKKMHLCRENNKIIQQLLSYGAHLNVRNKQGYSPLHKAIVYNNHQAISLLIEMGANLNVKEGLPPTILALALGDLETIRLVLKNNPDTSIVGKYGETLLHLLLCNKLILEEMNGAFLMDGKICYSNFKEDIFKGWLELVRELLKRGVDPNKKENSGTTCDEMMERVIVNFPKENVERIKNSIAEALKEGKIEEPGIKT